MSTREFWDNEAATDERYQSGTWGIRAGGGDREPVIDRIMCNLYGVRRLLNATTQTIAEVGCGPGRLLNHWARWSSHDRFIGVDISWEMTELGKATRPSNVQIVINDGKNLPGWPCPDLIYSVELFQHLDEAEKINYLNEMFRWLNPGGLAVIQFVTVADEGPMSHPTSWGQMMFDAKAAGFITHLPAFMWRLTAEWDWCLLEKPI